MNYIKKLFQQSSYYFISNVFVMLAGFISFPILTRIFTPEEYGVMSLVTITVSLGIGFSKFGLQHAALRYFSDFKENVIKLNMSYYYSTLFIGSLTISGLIVFSAFWITKLCLSGYLNKSLQDLVLLIVLLIFVGALINILSMFLRADNRGALYSVFTIARRYGHLLLGIIIVVYIMENVRGLFIGFLISDVLLLIVLMLFFIRKIKLTSISPSFLKEAVSYSFPLIWMELSNMILNFGDRYLLQYYKGSESVGLYSAAYNVCNLSQSVLSVPLRLAVIPMYMSIWNKEGKDETKGFLDKILDYYIMIGVPVIIGLSWFGDEFVTLLATSKYLDAVVIIPVIILPLIVFGGNVIFTAGLRIYKKTRILMYMSLLAGVVNVILNILFIPRFGMLGAAYATLISYCLLVVTTVIVSYRYLVVKMDVKCLIKYIGLSLLIMYSLSFFHSTNVGEMLLKIILVLIAYSLGIMMIDKKKRNNVLALIKFK